MILPGAASAQAFVAGLGGAAALSNSASATAQPLAASNYDAKVGPAFNLAAGYHFNDWFSFQVGYIRNQNRVASTQLSGGLFLQQETTPRQQAVSGDLLVYFRPRTSSLRPYLSVGPAWVHVLSQNRSGLRVAVGMDVKIHSGWGFRYTFSETMSANPLSAALHPPAQSRLMNFQNLFGVVKVF